MDFIEVLSRRRSCRDFTSESVSKDEIDEILRAAKKAPTASNIPYRQYILVDDKKVIRAIQQISPSFLANPPIILVIFTDLSVATEKVGRVSEYSSLVDSGASGENVLLATTNLGLGSQFTMISHMVGIRRILGLPDHCRVDLILPIGHPAGKANHTKARVGANVTYHNQYGVPYE